MEEKSLRQKIKTDRGDGRQGKEESEKVSEKGTKKVQTEVKRRRGGGGNGAVDDNRGIAGVPTCRFVDLLIFTKR